MCGIAGILGGSVSAEERAQLAHEMTDAITHRGPDGEGHLIQGPLAMGMRRLAIIDLSGGDQPIWNEDHTVGVIFNGEIYNFQTLREELLEAGHTFSTSADTEVIVHLFEDYGVDAFAKLEGMFAIALWDMRSDSLTLVRDRLGKKPLFVANADDDALLFGSELKSILAYPNFTRSINHQAFARFLVHECVPGPQSMLNGVSKLEPGTWMKINSSTGDRTHGSYWSLSYEKPVKSPSYQDAVSELRVRLEDTVSKRLVSDVPLGVFLSGGIDSSAVAAMMRKSGADKIETFSIAFEEESFDESAHARKVAAHLNTEHHEETLSAESMVDLVGNIGRWFDEPVADPSILPTYVLSRFTKERVTVALGGDGGDEVFAGYPTYTAHKAAAKYAKIPKLMRRGMIEPAVRALPASDKNFSLEFKAKRFISAATLPLPDRHATWMAASRPDQVFHLVSSGLREELGWSSVAQAADDLLEPTRQRDRQTDASEWINRVGWQDLSKYLRDIVLVKVDRASMAASLEVRAPFLDHTLVEWASQLPSEYLFHKGTTKRILKDAVRDMLPGGIVDRPKKGFGIPLAQWLRGPLKPLLLELTEEARIRDQGLLDPTALRALVESHLSGYSDERKALWPILTFQLWWNEWMENP